MTDSSPVRAARPLSPHVQVWRWHITMVCSIAHRATGVALYGGALLLAAWAISLAVGPDAYEGFRGVMGSIPGKLVLFALTVSIFYHLASGVRHLVWDAGKLMQPHVADMVCAASLAFGGAAAIAVWIIAGLMGAL